MPTAAGRPLLRAVEAAGQDRPDDAGEAAHGSAPEAADGGRVQTRGDGGANAGAQIRSNEVKEGQDVKEKRFVPLWRAGSGGSLKRDEVRPIAQESEIGRASCRERV